MAGVVQAYNPFKRLIMRQTMGGGGGGAEGGRSGSGAGGPMAALSATGDPSLNQTFSGPAAGFAQFGQVMAQRAAGKREQTQLNSALDELGQKLQEGTSNGKSSAQVIMDLLRDDPKSFLALSRSGVLNDAATLQKFIADNDKTQAQIKNMQQPVQQTQLPNGQIMVTAPGANGATGVHMTAPQEIKIDPNNGAIVSRNGNVLGNTGGGKVSPGTLHQYTDENGKDAYGRAVQNPDGTYSLQPVQMPAGTQAGAPGKWTQQDNQMYSALKDMGTQLSSIRQNIGASMGLGIGSVLGKVAEKTGIGGDQTKAYLAAHNALLSDSNAMSAGGARLKQAYADIQNRIPSLGNSEDYNREFGLPSLEWSYRQHIAGMMDYLQGAKKAIPQDLQDLAQQHLASPNYLSQIDTAKKTLATSPGSLTADQIQRLGSDQEFGMLDRQERETMMRQMFARGAAPPNDVSGQPSTWDTIKQQFPHLADPLQPNEIPLDQRQPVLAPQQGTQVPVPPPEQQQPSTTPNG